MATQPSPGAQTSEHAAMKTAQIWIRFAAAIIASIATALLATGVIPPESSWVGILGMLASVGAMVAGEVATAKNYTASRTAVKIATEAAKAGTANPTPPPGRG